MRRRRGLTEEEKELWSRVAASAQALHPAARPELPPETERAPKPHVAPIAPQSLARAFRVGEKAHARTGHDLAPPIGERLAAMPVTMDRKAHKNMVRGKLEPDARIDLHGMTLAQAHPELIGFVLGAQDRGHRLILIITGKGKGGRDDGPIPQRMGVLRHQVPHWLRLPPLGAVVMQVTEAHLKHGGSGAYYVYLRRLR